MVCSAHPGFPCRRRADFGEPDMPERRTRIWLNPFELDHGVRREGEIAVQPSLSLLEIRPKK